MPETTPDAPKTTPPPKPSPPPSDKITVPTAVRSGAVVMTEVPASFVAAVAGVWVHRLMSGMTDAADFAAVVAKWPKGK